MHFINRSGSGCLSSNSCSTFNYWLTLSKSNTSNHFLTCNMRKTWLLSTDGHWRQFNPIKNSQFGVWWRKIYLVQNSSIVIQNNRENSIPEYEATLGPDDLSSYIALVPSAPCPSASLCSTETTWVCQLSQKITIFILCLETASVLPKPEESWLLWEEVPAPGPWFVHPHANEESNTLQFEGSKRHFLTGQSGTTLIGQSCTAPIEWGKTQCWWLE